MADENSARSRLGDSFGRGAAPAAPANDPLAELARLIGQNDPLSGYGRETHAPAPQPETAPPYESAPAPPYVSEPAPRFPAETPPPRYIDPAPQYAPEPAPRYQDLSSRHQDSTPRYAAEYPVRHAADPAPMNDWPGTPAPAPSYPPSDPFALPSDPVPQPDARHYDSRGYVSPNFPSPNQPSQNYPRESYPSHSYADPLGRPGESYQPQLPGFDPPGYAAAPPRLGFPPPLYPQEPEAGSMPPPHDDEFYDDAPRSRPRKGLLTIAAVLGLAVIGTAGAFGYRSLFGGPGSSAPPPVIRASGEPSKVAPPPASTDQSASKFSYDRFGDAGKDEQVVRREEKPVDVSRVATPPRSVFPGAPVVNSPSTRPPNAATTAAANPPSAIGEPRRVRTVPIRPDQGDAALPPPPAPAMAAPPRQANAAVSVVPVTRQAPAPVANAPLSLSPDANANALPPPSAQASAPPPPRPARVASAPASGGGSYLVQVSSQRSEADAQNAYRGIQSKYSSVLGSHPHTIRRADLGTKGVYYRAMVGPFGSREEAVQVCVSLKQAGGDCVVQH